MEDTHQDGSGEGNRSWNQHPQNRNWNPQRFSNRKTFRSWNNGNSYNNGNGNGNGNGSTGSGNNGRGGFRNGPRHHGSFSSQYTPTQGFNAQNNPSHGFLPREYPGGNNFPSVFGGPGNFNQGYNPNVNQNFLLGHPGNNPPQHYPPQGYPPVGAFANSPVFFNQMPVPEGSPPPFPPEYSGMPNPGYPMFAPNPYPPSSLPPMMPQPQSPQPLVNTHTRRRPPRPNEPLIVSSQPQFDTDRHRQLYYFPDQEFGGMQPSWTEAPGVYYMQPDYSQYPPVQDHHSRQSSLEAPYPGASPRAEASESTLTQIQVGPIEGETTERGRPVVRDHHSNTDGGSDVPTMTVSPQTQGGPLPVQIKEQDDAKITNAKEPAEFGIEPTKSQSESTEPENNPNEPHPEPIKPEPAESESTKNTSGSSHAPAVDEEHKKPSDETANELEIETKSVGSAETSDGVPGHKTPDTEKSQELANVSTTSQPSSHGTVVAQKTEESKSPDTEKLDKGKSPAKDKSPAKCHARPGSSVIKDTPKPPVRNAPRKRKPLKEKYQPKTDTGKTIADYTKEVYLQMLKDDPSFQFEDPSRLEETIKELEDEWREKTRAEEGYAPADESPGSGSPKSPKSPKAPKAKSVA